MPRPKIISYSRDCAEVKILHKSIVYRYNIFDWLVMERILRKPIFTFKDWNKLKKHSRMVGKK